METLLALPIIGLLYGGGFLFAFLALLLATFRKTRRSRIVLSAIALALLTAQGGCWHIASDIGRATGGGGDGSVMPLMIIAGLVALRWSILLITSPRAEIRNKK